MIGTRLLRWLTAAAAAAILAGPSAAIGPAGAALHAQQRDAIGTPRAGAPLTILQINDVYSLVPVDGAGGVARVASLKQRLAAEGHTPLLMIAGDFLSSSVASTVFKGEQMIAALNAAGLDVATLGNHEFDFGIDILLQRMKQARWQWVISNVVDAAGAPIGGAAPYLVRTFGPLKVGIIGLCASEGILKARLDGAQITDPIAAAASYIPRLRAEGVDTIVALTHLTFAEDRALAERFPEIDVIVGGHEHFPIAAVANRTFISKAGSDAKWVARIDITRRPTGTIERFYELIPVTAALPDEPRTAEVVAAWESKLGPELQRVVAATRVPLVGTSRTLRASETNLGNLVADAVRAQVEAEAAIVNSGGIRGDREIPPGPLLRRTLVELHPFGNVVCKLEVPGAVIRAALEHGVERLPAAAGQFPQVSGLKVTVNPAAPPGQRVREVLVGDRPLDASKTYTLAVPDFLLLGGDGYEMFKGQKVLISPEDGATMVTALERYLSERREIAPAVEGRIRFPIP